MKFFTSDLHFGHKNILKYQPDRPWASVDDMREGLITLWNSVVTPSDDVYIIGDFAFLPHNKQVEILTRLNGNKYLIKGNHDDVDNALLKSQFVWIKDYYELRIPTEGGNTQKICMSHYAMRVWNSSHKGSWNLYGHSHGSLPPLGKQLDVGVDATIKYHEWFGNNAGVIPFSPVSFDQIKILLDPVEALSVDHH